MNELFDWVAIIIVLQLMAILSLVETDRACKGEPTLVRWSRRLVFLAGSSTLIYAAMTHDWQTACLLMAMACVPILGVNIASIVGRNKPPLHGARFHRRAHIAGFWRRYP
jgi:hypothetical protein